MQQCVKMHSEFHQYIHGDTVASVEGHEVHHEAPLDQNIAQPFCGHEREDGILPAVRLKHLQARARFRFLAPDVLDQQGAR